MATATIHIDIVDTEVSIITRRASTYGLNVIGVPGPEGPQGPAASQASVEVSADLPAFCVVAVDGTIIDSTNVLLYKRALGLLLAATSSGFAGNYQTVGEVSNEAWNWTPGDDIYLNGTVLANNFTGSAFVLYIGRAKTRTTIDLNSNWTGYIL